MCGVHSEFNARWHQEHLEKDEQERQLKQQRRSAASDAMRGHLDAKHLQVSKKKETNRCVWGLAAEFQCISLYHRFVLRGMRGCALLRQRGLLMLVTICC